MSNIVVNPYPIYTDVDGNPLEDGYIFIGEEGLNPETNPLQAYWDAGLTVPAANIRTKGGYPNNNGSPGRLYLSTNYSILVKDKRGSVVYSVLDAVDYSSLPPGVAFLDSTDTTLAEGEKLELTTTLELRTDNYGEIAAYDPLVTYNTPGTLVRSFGDTYSASGEAGNLDKDPSDPANELYWYPADDAKTLEKWAKRAEPMQGCFHGVTDRAGANYRQNLLINKTLKGAQAYDFYLVMQDGTVITGDTHLEDDIFKIGTADQYPKLSMIATENLGIWTLKDKGGQTQRAQTIGDDFDVMGGFVENQLQGHDWFMYRNIDGSPLLSANAQRTPNVDRTLTGDNDYRISASASDPANAGKTNGGITSDGISGTPRTGSKTYGDTEVMGITPMVIMSKA